MVLWYDDEDVTIPVVRFETLKNLKFHIRPKYLVAYLVAFFLLDGKGIYNNQ